MSELYEWGNSNTSTTVTLSNGQTVQLRKVLNFVTIQYSNSTSSAASKITGTLPEGYRPTNLINNKWNGSSLYALTSGEFEISANAWNGFTMVYMVS